MSEKVNKIKNIFRQAYDDMNTSQKEKARVIVKEIYEENWRNFLTRYSYIQNLDNLKASKLLCLVDALKEKLSEREFKTRLNLESKISFYILEGMKNIQNEYGFMPYQKEKAGVSETPAL